MVNGLLARDRFPIGIMRGLIALLAQEGDCLRLTNWQPIMLLNIAYKIFAKALQRQLQPLLIEVIDSDQTTFLPLRFILENSMLTHESIQWAKESRQVAIFIKFDFSKACDRVD
jgi:hypothetical protein